MAEEGAVDQKQDDDEEALPLPWQKIQGAIWLIGIAILAWQNWWWPGILILVAISGLTEALIRMQVSRQQARIVADREATELAATRALHLPEVCPSCGSPVNADEVTWTGEKTATCAFCASNLKAVPGEEG